MTIVRYMRRQPFLFVASAIASTLLLSFDARAQSQEEINKQIAKLTSDAISARLAGSTASALMAPNAARMPNNAWASYTNLGLEFAGFGSTTTDIAVLGYDRDLSSALTVGAALNTAKTRHQSGDSVGVSPYLAYRFSDRYFAIARLDYSRFDASGVKVDTYGLGASMNTVQPFGSNWLLKGEVGLSTSHSKAKVRLIGFSSDISDDSWGWTVNGQADYRFGSGWTAFAGLNTSGTDDSHSTSLTGSVGIEKAFSSDGAVLLKYETRLADDLPSGSDIDTRVFTIAARWRF